jgi:hypothetical protein
MRSCSSNLGGDSSYDAPGVRHSRRRRTRSSVRSGSSAAASVRQATKPSGRTNNAPSVSRRCAAAATSAPLSSTPKRYIHRGVRQASAFCAPQLRPMPRHWPREASSTKRRPYRSMVEISEPPKVTSTCGARVPGSPAIAPWGKQRRDVLRRAKYGQRAVYR